MNDPINNKAASFEILAMLKDRSPEKLAGSLRKINTFSAIILKNIDNKEKLDQVFIIFKHLNEEISQINDVFAAAGIIGFQKLLIIHSYANILDQIKLNVMKQLSTAGELLSWKSKELQLNEDMKANGMINVASKIEKNLRAGIVNVTDMLEVISIKKHMLSDLYVSTIRNDKAHRIIERFNEEELQVFSDLFDTLEVESRTLNGQIEDLKDKFDIWNLCRNAAKTSLDIFKATANFSLEFGIETLKITQIFARESGKSFCVYYLKQYGTPEYFLKKLVYKNKKESEKIIDQKDSKNDLDQLPMIKEMIDRYIPSWVPHHLLKNLQSNAHYLFEKKNLKKLGYAFVSSLSELTVVLKEIGLKTQAALDCDKVSEEELLLLLKTRDSHHLNKAKGLQKITNKHTTKDYKKEVIHRLLTAALAMILIKDKTATTHGMFHSSFPTFFHEPKENSADHLRSRSGSRSSSISPSTTRSSSSSISSISSQISSPKADALETKHAFSSIDDPTSPCSKNGEERMLVTPFKILAKNAHECLTEIRKSPVLQAVGKTTETVGHIIGTTAKSIEQSITEAEIYALTSLIESFFTQVYEEESAVDDPKMPTEKISASKKAMVKEEQMSPEEAHKKERAKDVKPLWLHPFIFLGMDFLVEESFRSPSIIAYYLLDILATEINTIIELRGKNGSEVDEDTLLNVALMRLNEVDPSLGKIFTGLCIFMGEAIEESKVLEQWQKYLA